MNREEYERVFEKLVELYPHEIEKIKQVVNDASTIIVSHPRGLKTPSYLKLKIDYSDIIKSKEWSSDEKVELINFFGYNKSHKDIKFTDERNKECTLIDFKYVIDNNNFSSFEALIRIYKEMEHKDFKDYDYENRTLLVHNTHKCDNTFRQIFSKVLKIEDEKIRTKYLNLLSAILTEEDKKRLIKPYYLGIGNGISSSPIKDLSIFIDVLKTKNIGLVKEYLKYVEDINLYFPDAVETGSVEVVQLFLDNGANINYLTDEVILGKLSPLKTAINISDFNMFNYLIEKGADISKSYEVENLFDKILNFQPHEYETYYLTFHEIKSADDAHAKKLAKERKLDLLDFAIKLKKDKFYDSCSWSSSYNIYFEGSSSLVVDYIMPKNTINRGMIVDAIFDKLQDKSNINYTDLLVYAIMLKNYEKFEKYAVYAFNNNYAVDLEMLLKLYSDFAYGLKQYNKEITIKLINFLCGFENKDNLLIKLFYEHQRGRNDLMVKLIKGEKLNKNWGLPTFDMDDIDKLILSKISDEKRKTLCLVPYCRCMKDLQSLLELNFDINQVDKFGNNILFNLFRYCKNDFESHEIALYKYLIDKADLSYKNKDGNNILYYAIQAFPTEDELDNLSHKSTGIKSEIEILLVDLINRLDIKDINSDIINEILEERASGNSEKFGEYMDIETIYQNHKELFLALLRKGYKLSDELLKLIFNKLYQQSLTTLKDSINYPATLKFVYSKLDKNTNIQKMNIHDEFQQVINNSSDKEFIEKFKEFCKKVNLLKTFYEENIMERFCPEKYIQFAEEFYKTTYKNLDIYILRLIMKYLALYGSSRLAELLDAAPNFDLNAYVKNYKSELKYWEYISAISNIIDFNEDGEPIYGEERFDAVGVYECGEYIEFTGNLMQYLILMNDVRAVDLLVQRGVSLKFIYDNEDKTWDYVNSYTMKNYMESVLGNKEFKGLNDGEKDYLMNLLGENTPKRVLEKKEGSDN